MYKHSKLFLALAFALVLCVSCVTTAFAAGDPVIAKDQDHPVQVAITKILQMPKGTNTPSADFVFNIEAKTADAPAIGPKTISFGPSNNGTTPPPPSDVKSVPLESKNIFNGITFPHAGTYVYEITEDKGASYQSSDPNHEQLTYSPAKYILTVYVKNKTAPATGTYIYAIGDVIEEVDNSSQNKGDKVDPTPGGDPSIVGDYSKMIFTNTYVKTNGPEIPTEPKPDKPDDATLSVSKTVSGEFANMEAYFDFTMKVIAPSLIKDPPVYKAYVVENGQFLDKDELLAGNGITAADKDKNDHYYGIFTPGYDVTFKLKHGQKLIFVDTPVGTSYTVTETAAEGYETKYVITTNSEEKGYIGLSTGLRWVGEKLNSADYKNDRSDVTPTGLNLNDLPFLGMIFLAFGAVAAFAVAKARKMRKMARSN